MSLLLLMLLVPAAAYAEGFYLGLGATWSSENFDYEGETDFELDIDDAYGINARAGYAFSPHVALELNADWVNFELDGFEREVGFGGNLQVDGDIEIFTLMPAVKFSMATGALRPYALFGLGWMRADYSIDAEYELGDFDTERSSDSEDKDDIASKAGGGLEFYFNPNFSLGVEYTYVWGWDELDEIQYHNVTAGVGFHF
jgi:opacity protein-like surface antigen